MSSAKHGLPTSLTPDVLKEALGYEPRHWKVLKARLARKRPAIWGDMKLSDNDFYVELHRNLQDPINRQEFEIAAGLGRRHPQRLSLYRRIFRHHIERLDREESFRSHVPEKPSCMDIVNAVACYGDDDCLANLVWLFLEEGAITDQQLSDIAREHSGVHERLGFLADDDETEVGSPENQWTECLSRIRDTVEEAGGKGPDSGVVDILTNCIDALRQITTEAERSANFWTSFTKLIRKHRDVLSDQPSLKPYVDWMDQHSSSGPAPENAAELLETLDGFLRSLAGVVGAIRVKSGAMAGADAEQRDKIVKEVTELSANESKLRSDTEEVLSKLLPDVDADAATDVSEVRMDTSTTRTDLPARPTTTPEEVATQIIAAFRQHRDEKRGTDGEPFDIDAEKLESTDHEGLTDDPKADSQPPPEDSDAADEPASADLESAVGTERSTHEVGATEEASKGPNSPEDETSTAQDSSSGSPASQSGAVSAPKVSTDGVPEGKAATSGSSPDAAPHQGDSSSPAESEVRVSGERTAALSASDALDEMLSSGRFARAYWLIRAAPTLGNPDLYGALAEGARIGPGDPCPGALIHFYSGLAHKDHWLDDEQLLLSASVLGPCLFVDPLPQDIYQLANEFPTEGSPVGPFMERVRALCVYRNAKIRPKDLGVESPDAVRNARLYELASDADMFLHRVPHIRFLYAPAELAIRFIYRTGSEWHRLHTIVGGDQRNRLNEAQALVDLLNPREVVATLHDEDGPGVLKQPLDGRARDKLARHLHDSVALAREWCRLVFAINNGGPSGNQSLSAELLAALKRLLPAARKALIPHKGQSAADALDFVLENLDVRVQGRVPVGRTLAPISGDLRLLPGVLLEDDLEPVEGDLEDLRNAILEAERSEPEPNEILRECLGRQEYRRAREIIEIHQLGERAQSQYQRAVSDKRSTLESDLDELEVEIEDAFLLGQLRDDTERKEAEIDQARNAIERSQLLGVVRDARRKLNQSDDSDADELREVSHRIDELRTRTNEMTSTRRERLRREFDDLMERLPQTRQGEDDRNYLREAFDECLQGEDHVAAFDLLDRGRKAAQSMEAVVRATTGSSEDLDRFLMRADRYREALKKRDWLGRSIESIRQGSTFMEIAFGQLDRTHREEASDALRAWDELMRIQFRQAGRELVKLMEVLFRFLGLPSRAGGIQIVDSTEARFAHVRATLTRPVASSPLPAFGSACGNRFEIVVGQTRKEPEQFEEYIRGRGLADRPVLAFLLLPQSSAYRIRWQRHFAHVRLTVLPLDPVFLLHLCGERNRLPVLFELGLPFTWTRPYITKGENVSAEMFVGRSDEAAALMDPEGSCIVFGGRQLGKSALLRHVHRENHNPGKSIYVVYLDVDDLGTESQGHDAMVAAFWRRVYAELRRYEAIPELPQKMLDRGNRLVVEVPDSISTCLSKEQEMRIVLLLDETDDLLDCDSGRDFTLVRRLRGLMANSDRRFKVVFAGLHSVQRYYNWKNHPFAQLGEELVVNPLPPAAAQELVIRPLRALGFAFENTSLVLRILSQTNYHPGLIQIIGYRLLENLFEKRQRQDTVVPVRTITADDILGVERDDSVMEDIRNRFDWTLDLDDRYKVLTYALVLTPDPTASHRESEFMDIGTEWWPAVFQMMDAQGLRAVLDEMVGLGVLLREHDDEAVRTYRLRSPNLLRLLGSREAIDDELLRIIGRDQVNRPNPRNFHPIIDRKPVAFGPLTNEQAGQIDGLQRPFQLTLITGSEALGLNDVERQFDRLFSEVDEDKRSKAWKKIPYVGPTDADAFVKKFRESLRSRRRTHRFAVVRLGEIEYEGELSVLFKRLIRELGQVCTNESKAHLVLLLDPRVSWQWLRDRNREQVLSQSRVTGLELRRWSDGAIANAFDLLDARTASQIAGGEVFRLTSGFHCLVNQGMSRAKPHSGANASTLVDEWQTLCNGALADGSAESALLSLGLRGTDPELESCVWEVLRLRETRDGRPVLTETSFDLAAEALADSYQQWFETHADQMREWMCTMDLVRPLNPREKLPMALASWVQDVIGASEG